MSSLSPQTRRNLLYLGVALNAFSVYKHSQLSIARIFPLLDKSPSLPPSILTATKGCLLLVGAGWVSAAILQLKWAKYGVLDKFDKALLSWYCLSSFAFGVRIWMKRLYLPLIPLWAAPLVTGLSQL